jgi:hypothetical protein
LFYAVLVYYVLLKFSNVLLDVTLLTEPVMKIRTHAA